MKRLALIFSSLCLVLTGEATAELRNQDYITVKSEGGINYLLSLADKENHLQPKPLLIFLHGAGERGDDIDLVRSNMIPDVLQQASQGRFVIFAPQCPADSYWTMHKDKLQALIEKIVADYHIDLQRIYLTGYSMGAYGTWDFAATYPNTFAAIAPVAGGVREQDLQQYKSYYQALTNTPIWAFHGQKDHVVPIREQQRIIDLLKPKHPNLRFSVDPQGNHDSWDFAYQEHDIYNWFLSHSLPKQ